MAVCGGGQRLILRDGNGPMLPESGGEGLSESAAKPLVIKVPPLETSSLQVEKIVPGGWARQERRRFSEPGLHGKVTSTQ